MEVGRLTDGTVVGMVGWMSIISSPERGDLKGTPGITLGEIVGIIGGRGRGGVGIRSPEKSPPVGSLAVVGWVSLLVSPGRGNLTVTLGVPLGEKRGAIGGRDGGVSVGIVRSPGESPPVGVLTVVGWVLSMSRGDTKEILGMIGGRMVVRGSNSNPSSLVCLSIWGSGVVTSVGVDGEMVGNSTSTPVDSPSRILLS